MKKIIAILSMFVCLIIAAGCGSTPSTSTNLLTSPDAVAKAMEALQNKDQFKGKELRIFQTLNIFPKEISVDVVKPGTEKVDHYTYSNGEWSGPSPVQLSGDGTVAENSVPISEYDFTKLPTIMKTLDEKEKEAKVENPKPINAISYLFDPSSNSKEVSITVEGDRAKYRAHFSFKGEFVDFVKD